MEGKGKTGFRHIPASFKIGAIALAFLIIGYQTALFIHSAGVMRIISHRDEPDTVFVVDRNLAGTLLEEAAQDSSARTEEIIIVRHASGHDEVSDAVVKKLNGKKVESFPFNPNTAGVNEFIRLGFSEKQARAIINYREKGGRFRRPEDFAKSFVVSDSVFRRLEPYIRIPKTDINAADSAEFDNLPGIGPYFAAKMVSYREELGGYSYPEQLMDIYNFDQERYDGLKDLIMAGPSAPYPLWTLDEKELQKHPYIGKYAAHGIIVYRDNNPQEALTVEGLMKAGVLSPEMGSKLAGCRIAVPQ